MTIVRWDPFRDFGFTAGATWVPPVDVFQTGEHELVLKAELPDMTREDIDVTVENFVLTIKGEKKLVADVKDEQFHHIERRHIAFSSAPFPASPWIPARWQPSIRTAC
jgi:HSP20 family protein